MGGDMENITQFDQNGKPIKYKEMWCPQCKAMQMYLEGRWGPKCEKCGCESFVDQKAIGGIFSIFSKFKNRRKSRRDNNIKISQIWKK